ncbi:hypothetical protein SPBR_08235 [Sporothrix brasiliensis 5110]|uniref:ESCRT-I complex subunit n=1 Tax=Sporothrix brasiliensis 5110 TaxID=1398154 RepID=A0A0C2IP91_9PEZI|nr:uncharacterized protein SPBR_08235 [Sporothrix brasiliensis 5110]KIH86892.1 hypothetical protein SPBR_08235 [Sporothrix brasiliensis 5110]
MAVQQHVLNWLYSVLTSEYQDVNRTYNDVSQALSYFPSLSPRTDVHTFPNGASALLLHLSGTIPAVFRGATYRYPISLWVPHNYPREAPLVYVTPTENMMVRPGQHVDPQGQVYHPYLAGWAEFWDKSTICDFLTILRDVFAKEPPVIARQAPRAAPLQAPAASPTPPPVPPPPQELASPPHPPPLSPKATASRQQQQQQQQQQDPPPPPPPPKANGQPQHSAAVLAHHTPSPPPVPPHPSYTNGNNAYPASQATPSPPPPPPHPSTSGAGGVRSSWYGASPPPPQAVEAGPSARSASGGPPVPGRPERPDRPDRPAYQQSPLGQPPMSPSQQHQQPPYNASYGQPQPLQPSKSSPPPPSVPYGHQSSNAYYQYQQQQQQPQLVPPPWQQQQQQQQQFQQYNPQQQQQQYPPQQQFLQQVQSRPRQPPPPDLMDEPATNDAPNGPSDGAHLGDSQSGRAQAGSVQPPPVPRNPEKDALLHQLAQTLAAQRQQIRDKNDLSLAGLRAQRAAMLTAAQRLQQDMSDVAQLSALLTSNTDILHETLAAADGLVASSQQTPAPAVDDLLVGPTVVANQLYDLVAEERALADAVFMLGRAVERGRVSPVVFAKMTRSLAREWYLKKALVRKVGRGMGLASA